VKFLPAIFAVILTLFVGAAFFMPEHVNPLARLSTKESKEFAHYDKIFQETTLVDINGTNIHLARMDAPVVILNFWASWCKPCLEEFPSLVQLRKQFKPHELVVIAINSDEEDQELKMTKTINEFGLEFIHISDSEGELINKFLISALPMSIIYKNGKVHSISKGRKDFMAEEFVEFVRSSLTKISLN
jgi:thiol-disulfide isomerase/thioredoxin